MQPLVSLALAMIKNVNVNVFLCNLVLLNNFQPEEMLRVNFQIDTLLLQLFVIVLL